MDSEHSWADLPAEAKRQQRFQIFTSPQLPFISSEAEAAYKARAARMRDAIFLRRPPTRAGDHPQPVLPGPPGGIHPLRRDVRPRESG